MRSGRYQILIILLLGLLLLAACRGASTPTTDPAQADAPAPTSPPQSTATATQPSQATDATTMPTEIIPATDPVVLDPGATLELSGYELIAADMGEATYSGHQCVQTEAGCACELPEVITAEFTFTEDDTLKYRFAGNGYGTTMEMTHIGVNHWIFSQDIFSVQRDETVGVAQMTLSFTEEGFVTTYVTEFFEPSQIITCPDVHFKRVSSGS